MYIYNEFRCIIAIYSHCYTIMLQFDYDIALSGVTSES